MGNSASSFSYSPLDPQKREIRLIRILPGTGLSAHVHCNLFEVTLDSAPRYEALSYTWDAPEPTGSLTVNGMKIVIRKNLEVALKHLRQPHTERIFWIDAVCINQDDIQERNEQVSRMRDIYRGATSVVVWLGLESSNSNLAVNLINEAAEHDADDNAWVFELITNSLYDDYWQALQDFLNRGYWSRMWIIQEIAHARNLVVCCGSKNIRWTDLIHLQRLLFRSMPGCFQVKEYFSKQLELVIADKRFGEMEKFRRTVSSGQLGSESLYRLLVLHRRSLCTDPRDKVYALLGLVDCGAGEVQLPVDYSRSLRQVYTNAVSFCVLKRDANDTYGAINGPLNIICASQPRPGSRNLPTWCPDWTEQVFWMPLQVQSDAVKYLASGGSQPMMSLNIEGEFLSVQGFVLDQIGLLGEPAPAGHLAIEERLGREFMDKTFWEWCKMGIDHCSSHISDPAKQEVQKEKLWRTLICNRTREESPPPPEWTSQCYKFIAAGSVEALTKLSPEEFAFMRLYLAAMIKSTRGRRFCISSKDSHFLLAPMWARTGDLLCILLGCDFPVVLRQEAEHYYFVGEAYIHDVMDGQAMEGLESGRFALEKFQLH